MPEVCGVVAGLLGRGGGSLQVVVGYAQVREAGADLVEDVGWFGSPVDDEHVFFSESAAHFDGERDGRGMWRWRCGVGPGGGGGGQVGCEVGEAR